MQGIEEGLPQLLELFDQTGITVTFFTTGQVAEQYPELIKRIPQGGHELGCHGYSHKRFDRMNEKEARADLKAARTILEQLCPEMDSFRAPNLKFPPGYVGLLEEQGFTIDSSLALYKPPFARGISRIGGITRLPVTLTSSPKAPFADDLTAAHAAKGCGCLCPSVGIHRYVENAGAL
jgi:peptidoglycan/xylan/chitin deacetylase (PgdA/CDA1 family)